MSSSTAAADPRRFPFPPAIPAVALLVSWLLGKFWPIAVAWGAWTTPVGWFLLLVPSLLAFWAVGTFRRHKTVVHPRGNVTTIVRNGPFRFTRNPMYVTLMIMYIGGGLAFHLPWAAVLLVPVFLALHFGVIRPEEVHLRAKFGDAYLAYQRQVRRWL